MDVAAHGSLSFTIDGSLVRITGEGFWSSTEIDAHFRDLRRVIAATRTLNPCFRVIVDLRSSAVQTRETSERIESETLAIWDQADRIAIVLRAGLAKMQINRIIEGRNYQIFDDIHHARHWLDRD